MWLQMRVLAPPFEIKAKDGVADKEVNVQRKKETYNSKESDDVKKKPQDGWQSHSGCYPGPVYQR